MHTCPICDSPTSESICPECGYDIPPTPPGLTSPGDRYGIGQAFVIAASWQAIPMAGFLWLLFTQSGEAPLLLFFMFLVVPVMSAGFHRCHRVSLLVFCLPLAVLSVLAGMVVWG